MMISRNIRIIPTKEQENIFWQSAGVARWAYNYFLFENDRHYKEYKENQNKNKKTMKPKLSHYDVRKQITQLKKTDDYKWLNDVSANVPKQAIKDADKAYDRFFKKISNRPKPKAKYKSQPSFYVNYESLKRTGKGFKGEKLGEVKTSELLPKLKKNCLYMNPRIKHDGLHWYLSISYNEEDLFENDLDDRVIQLTDEIIGIDVGVSVLAYCSDNTSFPNINKTTKVKNIERKLKREQKKLSRKIQDNISHYVTVKGKDGEDYPKPIYKQPMYKLKNITKQRKVIKKLYLKLKNIRDNYLHQVSRQIVNKKPKRIIMEDLKIKNMMKNRHLAKSISNQKWYFFKMQVKQKAERIGIEFVNANTFYASSKLCSKCNSKKHFMPLHKRTYICENCGLEIDRDYNASINLAKYQSN